MTNEAAERLRAHLASTPWDRVIDAALATADRNAVQRTVERIRERLSMPFFSNEEYVRLDGLDAILDSIASDENPRRITTVVGLGDGTMIVTLDNGQEKRITEAEYLAWPRASDENGGTP